MRFLGRAVPTEAQPSSPTQQVEQERHLIISDYHIRHYRHKVTGQPLTAHDPDAMRLVELFMRWWKPTHEWWNGDFLDAHQVSKFCRDPRDAEGLEKDIAEFKATVGRHTNILPDARQQFNKGNHDIRVEHYIATKAPALIGLPELRFEKLMGLQDYGWEVHEYGERVPLTEGLDFEVTHGSSVRTASGSAAHAEMKGYSGTSGHTHRLAQVFRTDRRGTTSWLESGCLCRTEPNDWAFAPDWQQGFVTVTFFPGRGRYEITPVHIQRSGDTRWLCFAGRVLEV